MYQQGEEYPQNGLKSLQVSRRAKVGFGDYSAFNLMLRSFKTFIYSHMLWQRIQRVLRARLADRH